ncbi:hypothetical protein ACTWQB_11880 [Piscibacillus sp. B03]|uniref:hypothetical protein n=1 Tax=Piscibacillus sp. B03 TaxID=3457430 RepID=UPI003FCE9560
MYTITTSQQLELPKTYQLLYYPYSITEWDIEYKPLPFSKKRKEKVRIVTNLLRQETAFFDLPSQDLKPLTKEKNSIIPNSNYSEHERTDVAKAFIRNYYIHKKKVWSNPKIDMKSTYEFYVPYAIYEDPNSQKLILHELYTNTRNLLKKHKELEKFFIN